MDCIYEVLFLAYNSKCFTSHVNINPFTHTFIQWWQRLPCKVPTCLSGVVEHFLSKVYNKDSMDRFLFPFKLWVRMSEKSEVQYLAQKNSNWTTNILISGRPSLPPQPQQLPYMLSLSSVCLPVQWLMDLPLSVPQSHWLQARSPRTLKIHSPMDPNRSVGHPQSMLYWGSHVHFVHLTLLESEATL